MSCHQGTQKQFYDDPRVMYVSIHRYEQGFWWPNLQESNYDHIGTGPGAGYNVNIPLNVTGNGDTEYLHAWHQVVLPVAYEYQPHLVLISAGYDPAIGCPEGEQRVSPACFAHFTHSLMALAKGSLHFLYVNLKTLNLRKSLCCPGRRLLSSILGRGSSSHPENSAW